MYAGVDTHAKTHALCVITRREEVVFEGRFSADRVGYVELEHALGGPKRVACVAIEGCTGYGRGLADHLKKTGYEVREALGVERRTLAPNGKSDEIDALNAAVKAARGRANPAKEDEGDVQALSALTIARDSAVKEATACANEILSCLRSAPEPVRERYERKTATKTAEALSHARLTKGPYKHLLMALISLAGRYKTATSQASALEAEMEAILKRSYRRLLTLKGVSTVTAATIVVSAGANPKRFKNDAAFSRCAGTSPIPASTANSGRHRLNQGGNRRLNAAIHRIVIVRLSCDERSQDYMARARARGKTRREAIRSLKRYVAREVFHALCSEEPELPSASLRDRRKRAGLTILAVANSLGANQARISRLERGLTFDSELEKRYVQLLDEMAFDAVEKDPDSSK